MLARLASPLLILLALGGCGRHGSPHVFLDPALATLVPPDTIFMAGIRVQQLQPTPIYQRYVKHEKIPMVAEFARETGIDVRGDLWEVVIAHDGKTRWVMLRGKFTEMGMEPRVNKEGAKRIGYKGYTMLGDENRAVLFLNPTTAIAASVPAVKTIIDNRDKSTGVPGWLNEKITTISSANQMWFAGHLDGLGLTGGFMNFRSGVDGQVSAVMKSPEEALRLRDAIALRLPGGIDVQLDRSTVQVKIRVATDRIDEIVEWVRPLLVERKP